MSKVFTISPGGFLRLDLLDLPLEVSGRTLLVYEQDGYRSVIGVISSCGKTGCCGAVELYLNGNMFAYWQGIFFQEILEATKKSVILLRFVSKSQEYPAILAKEVEYFNTKNKDTMRCECSVDMNLTGEGFTRTVNYSAVITFTPVETETKKISNMIATKVHGHGKEE